MEILLYLLVAIVVWFASEIIALMFNGTNWVIIYPLGKFLSGLIVIFGIFQHWFKISIK
jgi:hypothetical protein